MSEHDIELEMIDAAHAEVSQAIDIAERGEPFPSGAAYDVIVRDLLEDLDNLRICLDGFPNGDAQEATRSALLARLHHIQTRN